MTDQPLLPSTHTARSGEPPSTRACGASETAEQLTALALERAAAEKARIEKAKQQLARDLAELPELYALLPLVNQPGRGHGGKAPARHPSRPPLTLVVLDLLDTREKADCEPFWNEAESARDWTEWRWEDEDRRRFVGTVTETERPSRRLGVLPTLTRMVRRVDSDLRDQGSQHEAPADPATLLDECTFLLEHLDWMAIQPWFQQLARDVRRVCSDLQATTGERDEPTPLPCTICGWQMQGMGDYDPDRGRYPWYRCIGCRRAITTQAELDRVDQHARDLVTLSWAADQVERPLSTLKEWRQQGLLQPVGRDNRGSLYSLSAIRKVAALVRNGVNSRQLRP